MSSVELREMIPETEAALTAAEAAAQAERQKSLDPIASADTAEAEKVVWAAEFRRDRLRAALSRLRQRHDEVQAAEYAARRQVNYDTVKAKRDDLAKELAEYYPSLVDRFCDLFCRVKEVDQECARINSEAAAGEHRYLLGVELTARGLQNFSISNPSIMETVRLPNWEHSDHMDWPPPKIPLGALVAAAMAPPHDLRFSADWAAARQKDLARRAATETRRAEEEAARQVASRDAYEASLRR
jgi:hypothetical protein